jgi:hypothetical protein
MLRLLTQSRDVPNAIALPFRGKDHTTSAAPGNFPHDDFFK